MIEYYKTINGKVTPIKKKEKGCWISVQQPTSDELEYLMDKLGINENFIATALDENERSHIEVRDHQSLIIFDMPVEVPVSVEGVPGFYTIPVGFIICEDFCVSLISISSPIVNDVASNKISGVNTNAPNSVILSIIYHISHHFIMHLEAIDRIAFKVELKLHKSMKNQELIQILSLQKSLVYFTTSLNSTEGTLEKLLRGRAIATTEEDKELIEDTLIEIKQSIETAHVYTQVLASTVDAIGSIISNNMNIVMKVLTSITLVLSIPTMIFGFYGMNVKFSESSIHFVIPLIATIVICGISAWILYINDFF